MSFSLFSSIIPLFAKLAGWSSKSVSAIFSASITEVSLILLYMPAIIAITATIRTSANSSILNSDFDIHKPLFLKYCLYVIFKYIYFALLSFFGSLFCVGNKNPVIQPVFFNNAIFHVEKRYVVVVHPERECDFCCCNFAYAIIAMPLFYVGNYASVKNLN